MIPWACESADLLKFINDSLVPLNITITHPNCIIAKGYVFLEMANFYEAFQSKDLLNNLVFQVIVKLFRTKDWRRSCAMAPHSFMKENTNIISKTITTKNWCENYWPSAVNFRTWSDEFLFSALATENDWVILDIIHFYLCHIDLRKKPGFSISTWPRKQRVWFGSRNIGVH